MQPGRHNCRCPTLVGYMTSRRATAASEENREEESGAKPIVAGRRWTLRVVVLAGLVVAAGLLAYGRRASSGSPASVRPARTPPRPVAHAPARVPAEGRSDGAVSGLHPEWSPIPDLVGDSPQALIANLSETQADPFPSPTGQAAGFNSVWINLLCNDYTGGRPDGTTYDRIGPFTSAPVSNSRQIRPTSRVSTPWSASRPSMGSPCSSIQSRPGAGSRSCEATAMAKAYNYGRYLGRRLQAGPELSLAHVR